MTYHVVGCSNCHWLWIVKHADRRQTLQCPRCEQRRDASLVRTLYETDDPSEANDVRGAFLADRAGRLDDYEDVPAFAELDERWQQTSHVDDPTPPSPSQDQDEETDESADSTPTRASVGEGPEVDVDVAERDLLQTSGIDRPDLTDTFQLTSSPSQPVDAHLYDDVSAASSDWLPSVLDDLIPTAARLTQEIAAEAYSDDFDGRVNRFVDDVLLDVADVDDTPISVQEEARTYLTSIARYALLWTDPRHLKERGHLGHQYVREALGPDRDTGILRTIGTGRGAMNAPIEAVQHGPAALHALAEQPPVLVFKLDGQAWEDAHNETVEHALAAFDALASGVDVRLAASPQVARIIKRAGRRVANRDGDTPAWAARLTESSDTSHRAGATGTGDAALPLADAYDVLTEDAYQAGKRNLLLLLPTDGVLTVRDAKEKADAGALDVGRSTVGVYLPDLADAGLLDKTTFTSQSNEYELTVLGRAARRLLNDDGSVTHPLQLSLESGRYRGPPASRKSSVTPQTDKREEWLASTGDPTDHGRWVQWLGDSSLDRRFQPNSFHDRQMANRRQKGVSLVDERILNWRDHEDGDGRPVYLSAFNDEVLAMTQWGGSAATLARLASAVLSPLAWNGILRKSSSTDSDSGGNRLGEQFEKLFDGEATDRFESDLEDVLRLGEQIGWLSDDEMQHVDDWRDRIGDVIAELLSKLTRLDELDTGLQSEFYSKLQGLLTSATSLYASAGLDVTFNIRMPNASELARDDDRLQDFLDFMRFTVTKHAAYRDENGLHSIFRALIEDRPQKLKARLPKEIKEGDETAELTASWVVNGRGVTDLQDEIEAAIDAEGGRVRDRIQEGTEDAPVLDIPVMEAGTRGHTRRIVREIADRKGFDGADVDALVDVLHAYLGGEDGTLAPRDVVDVLDALAKKEERRDRLVPQSLAVGLAELPAKRLLPGLAPSATRMLQVLLEAGESLTAEDLKEATSERSYERHRQALLAVDLVEEAGPGEFVAFVEPWWTMDLEEPREDGHKSVFEGVANGSLFGWREAIATMFYDVEEICASTPRDGAELLAPPIDLAELREVFGEWAWLVDFTRRLLEAPPGGEAAGRQTCVRLGPRVEQPPDQTRLPDRPR